LDSELFDSPRLTFDRAALPSEPERDPPLFPVPECAEELPPEFEREPPESRLDELPDVEPPEFPALDE
jgi:hypothetical protein